jgi:hypothetical protein
LSTRSAPSIVLPVTINSRSRGSKKLSATIRPQANRRFEHEARLKDCLRARPSSTRPSTSTKATARPRTRRPNLTLRLRRHAAATHLREARSQTPCQPQYPDPTEKGREMLARPIEGYQAGPRRRRACPPLFRQVHRTRKTIGNQARGPLASFLLACKIEWFCLVPWIGGPRGGAGFGAIWGKWV